MRTPPAAIWDCRACTNTPDHHAKMYAFSARSLSYGGLPRCHVHRWYSSKLECPVICFVHTATAGCDSSPTFWVTYVREHVMMTLLALQCTGPHLQPGDVSDGIAERVSPRSRPGTPFPRAGGGAVQCQIQSSVHVIAHSLPMSQVGSNSK